MTINATRNVINVMNFTDELHKYLKVNRIRYEYLTEKTGYTQAYISKVLNGKLPPSSRFIKYIFDAIKKKHLHTTEELDYLERSFLAHINK